MGWGGGGSMSVCPLYSFEQTGLARTSFGDGSLCNKLGTNVGKVWYHHAESLLSLIRLISLYKNLLSSCKKLGITVQ